MVGRDIQYTTSGIEATASGTSSADSTTEDFFTYLGLVFGCVFGAELICNFFGWGPVQWAKSLWNWFDFFIVLVWVLEIFESLDLGVNPMMMRLVRMARLFRSLRLVRWIQ